MIADVTAKKIPTTLKEFMDAKVAFEKKDQQAKDIAGDKTVEEWSGVPLQAVYNEKKKYWESPFRLKLIRELGRYINDRR